MTVEGMAQQLESASRPGGTYRRARFLLFVFLLGLYDGSYLGWGRLNSQRGEGTIDLR